MKQVLSDQGLNRVLKQPPLFKPLPLPGFTEASRLRLPCSETQACVLLLWLIATSHPNELLISATRCNIFKIASNSQMVDVKTQLIPVCTGNRLKYAARSHPRQRVFLSGSSAFLRSPMTHFRMCLLNRGVFWGVG